MHYRPLTYERRGRDTMTAASKISLWNVCLGNFFEHYDSALFGCLSPFLAPLIFPDQDPMNALFLTYALIPLGMLTRPLGAVVFGYIGDVWGRRHALFLTLIGMAFISGCMAFIPTYVQVGILAPLLFCLARALQNFLAGGETVGGAIFLLENSPQKWHDFLSGLYSASTIGGHLAASFGVYLVGHYMTIDPGWRLLYLCGCLTALFGCTIRCQSNGSKPALKLSETLSNLRFIFWEHRKPLLLIAVTSGFASANYSIALVLMNGFIPLVSTFTATEMMQINSYLLIFDVCALPFFGWLASKVARETLMLSASVGIALFAIPLCALLEGASLTGAIGVRMGCTILGVAFFAPFYAWAQHLAPPPHRYAIVSFGYALGAQVIGAPTAALSLWCFKTTGIVSSIAWYWAILGLLSSLAVAKTLKMTNKVGVLEAIG